MGLPARAAPAERMPVIVIVADGARPDVLLDALDEGESEGDVLAEALADTLDEGDVDALDDDEGDREAEALAPARKWGMRILPTSLILKGE